MTMRAVELVIDWKAERVFWTFFEGEEDATDGVDRFHRSEVKRGDFPKPQYDRLVYRNTEAADRWGDIFVETLIGKATTRE